MEYALQILRLCQVETRRLLFVMGIVAVVVLLVQTLTLPTGDSSPESVMVENIPILKASNLIGSSVVLGVVGNTEVFDMDEEIGRDREIKTRVGDMKNDFALEKDSGASNLIGSSVVLGVVGNTEVFDMGKEIERNRETITRLGDPKNDFASEKDSGAGNVFDLDKERNPDNESSFENVVDLDMNSTKENVEVPENVSTLEPLSTANRSTMVLLQMGSTTSNNSTMSSNPVRKTMRCNMPPKSIMSISEMNRLLIRRHASSGSVRPQSSSIRDKELVSAKSQIVNAPMIRNNRELYAPLFRNVSMFKRSYELMERILKVYVYREGERPIFHQPVLKGIYASEGWFMKLMEGNKKFIVKDPRKAHLFYMPFSTRMLEFSLYVRNSHNRTNLAAYLKNYANMIAAKYSFWNRTSGADHFFVGCHDWAPYETRHHMERCIKVLCNADVMQGYKIGKDVSLPETYVRSAKNPLRDVGGKPPSERSILAFFAGSMHGYLRPILLQYWENKDPDMKIFGPMPPGVASKMNYIQHMKSSKYCICAKGYEVNSPRVVEAIFYECVPVIISDNFVPPFFDVLNWDAFSVILPEKDIPNLKDILFSIPEEKYLAMQLGVKKVQQHFLWHGKPVKYDLFYMTLHSIWYNRIFQLKPR